MIDLMPQFNELEKKLLNDFQQQMPMSATPYLDIANHLGVDEQQVIQSLKKLQSEGAVSRIGPVFKPNKIGVSTLAAMAVAEKDLDRVAAIVNAFGEVNHNYQRDHRYNLWFVATASDELQLQRAIQQIELESQYDVMQLPMLEDYHIDLGFKIAWD
jgi:siroheme decarboxylase